MKQFLWLTLFFFSIIIVSCGPNYVYEDKKELPDSGWAYEDTLQYQFSIEDTSKVYNQLLELNHRTDYGFQNLYVKVKTIFPSGKVSEQVLSLEIASKIGLWFGDCDDTNCILTIPIQNNIFFPEKGKYTFVLEQFMRKSPLEGIRSFELKIEDTGQQKKL